MLYSREPKLANLGFVWTPLPSLLVLPFLPLEPLWPPLVEQGFLANMLSAVAMAASARVLVGLLDDLGVPRRVPSRWPIAFGLQPMIIWFGAQRDDRGAAHPLPAAHRARLVRWLDDADFRHLMAAGGYLALGYLARYEVLASGCAAIALVGVVTWRRSTGGRWSAGRPRSPIPCWSGAAACGVPLWAIASWVIVGHPFDQFSSAYGNSALVESGGGTAAITPLCSPCSGWCWRRLLPLVHRGDVLAVRRRDCRFVPPVALLLPCWPSRHWCTSLAHCSDSSATRSSSSRSVALVGYHAPGAAGRL